MGFLGWKATDVDISIFTGGNRKFSMRIRFGEIMTICSFRFFYRGLGEVVDRLAMLAVGVKICPSAAA